MWILLWLKLTAAQGIDHFHLGTFYRELDCNKARSEAKVLLTDNNQAMECIFIPKDEGQY